MKLLIQPTLHNRTNYIVLGLFHKYYFCTFLLENSEGHLNAGRETLSTISLSIL